MNFLELARAIPYKFERLFFGLKKKHDCVKNVLAPSAIITFRGGGLFLFC